MSKDDSQKTPRRIPKHLREYYSDSKGMTYMQKIIANPELLTEEERMRRNKQKELMRKRALERERLITTTFSWKTATWIDLMKAAHQTGHIPVFIEEAYLPKWDNVDSLSEQEKNDYETLSHRIDYEYGRKPKWFDSVGRKGTFHLTTPIFTSQTIRVLVSWGPSPTKKRDRYSTPHYYYVNVWRILRENIVDKNIFSITYYDHTRAQECAIFIQNWINNLPEPPSF